MSVFGLRIEHQVGGEAAGDDAIERIAVAFERFGVEMANFGENIFPKLVPVFEAEQKRQADAQGGGPSGPWASLSPAYEAWKQQAYPGQPILQATGRMYEALTSSSSPFAARVFAGDEFNFGTQGLEYASFHQVGTHFMPARPPFDFSSDFERDITEAALEAAREMAKKAELPVEIP